jgi:hypothetical protein
MFSALRQLAERDGEFQVVDRAQQDRIDLRGCTRRLARRAAR